MHACNTAFKCRITTLVLTKPYEPGTSLGYYLLDFKNILEDIILSFLKNHSIKIHISVDCIFNRPLPRVDDIKEEEREATLKTSNTVIFDEYTVPSQIDIMISKLLAEYEEMSLKESGWNLKDISGMNVAINKYDPLKCGSFIPTPKKLKRFVINVKNDVPGNNYCFRYTIYSKHLKCPNRQKLSNYTNIETRTKRSYNFSGIEFPTTVSNITTFLKNNPTVSINIFGFDSSNKRVYPIRVTDTEKEDHYDILYLSNKLTSHYCYITNFNSLIVSQISKHSHRIFVCKRCFAHFPTSERLTLHKKYCRKETVEQPAQYSFPMEGKPLNFTKYNMTQPVDFVAFADFEVMLSPPVFSPNNNSNTVITHNHIPIAFSYYIVGPNNSTYAGPVHYVGLDAPAVFHSQMFIHALKIEQEYKRYPSVPKLSPQEESAFNSSTNCCICLKSFSFGDIRVIHHSHTTNHVFGAAHQNCNIQCKRPNFFPIFCHNLSRYDGHIIAQVVGMNKNRISVIPCTEENYISFSEFVSQKFSMRYLDSYRFLSSSLRTLVESLPHMNLIHTSRAYPDPLMFQYAQKKNFFPYEFFNNESKLSLTSLPPPSAFYSSLDGSSITEEDYKHAKEAWKIFNCETLKDYLVEYCKIDVLLLTDSFLSFREECLKAYTIDPLYCYSLPGFTFEAFLKLSGTKLDLLTNPDMYLFFESGIRGGITNTVRRYSKANCHRVPDYDSSAKPNTILYLDANNLYGHAMSQKLPISNFKFVKNLSKFTPDFIKNIKEDGDKGYFLEVDLDYPISLHDKHDKLPLCAEKKCPPNSKIPKLLCTLENKQNYVLHYRTLQFCLNQGLILKTVHRAVSFHQSNFLADYIKKNTEFRQHATSDFAKSLFKLMNNACFGKFIENQRGRITFDLVSNEERLTKLITSPFFKKTITFSENLVGVHRYKQRQLLNRPIYVGAAILELARLHMYEFYYNDLPKIFENIPFELLYMDTDSFILSIESADIYPYIQKNSQFFDCSDYPKNHPLYSEVNKKVPGKFKDEMSGTFITEGVFICSKIYSLQTTNPSKNVKRAKGVQTNIVKNQIQFENYKECLFEDKMLVKDQITFQSKLHNISTIKQKKLALHLADSK